MIKFHVVRWKNLLNTGNSFTEIVLDKSSTTLIVGKNGHGKSQILDAIDFALWKKPFRNINLPQLINSINQKELVVELEFSIGTNKYKIIRGLKPAVFEIWKNGVLVKQDAKIGDYQDYLEKSILKMSKKTFDQIVILGSAKGASAFMRLTTGARRGIIEDILDIQIFAPMNLLVKQKLIALKELLENNSKAKSFLDEKIRLLKQHLADMKISNQSKIDKNQEEIDKHDIEAAALADNRQIKLDNIKILKDSILDQKENSDKIEAMLGYRGKFDHNIETYKEQLKFYRDNDNCPTCLQEIPPIKKMESTQDLKIKLNKYEVGRDKLKSDLGKFTQRRSEIAKVLSEILQYEKSVAKIDEQINSIEKYIKKLQDENSVLKGASPVTGQDYQTQLDDAIKDLTALDADRTEMIYERSYHEAMVDLLSDDGPKTKIIKQYIPVINKLVNKYLDDMDFYANFTLDENFNEKIKSRHRDDFTYESFSEGQKQRIDLALLFTWRAIAKLKNSVSTNLLIMDEVFDSSLDPEGTDALLKIIQKFGEEVNIFIISHHTDILFDKFRSAIKFETKNEFSQMTKV